MAVIGKGTNGNRPLSAKEWRHLIRILRDNAAKIKGMTSAKISDWIRDTDPARNTYAAWAIDEARKTVSI
jgi:hypothetical protein